MRLEKLLNDQRRFFHKEWETHEVLEQTIVQQTWPQAIKERVIVCWSHIIDSGKEMLDNRTFSNSESGKELMISIMRKLIDEYRKFKFNHCPVHQKKGDVLFFNWIKNHDENALPVVRELLKNRIHSIVVTEVRQYWKENGFMDMASRYAYLRLSDFLIAILKTGMLLFPAIKFAKAFVANSNTLSKTDIWKVCFILLNPAVTLYGIAAKKALRFHHSNVIVIFNQERPPGMAAYLAAKKLAVKTIYVQHGALQNHPMYCHAPADRILVWGKADKEIMKKFVPEDEKVVVCGCTAFESLQHADTEGNSSIRHVMKILFTPTSGSTGITPASEVKFSVRTLYKALNSLEGIQLQIKLHPNDTLNVPGKILKEEFPGLNVTIEKNSNLHQKICESDVVITMASTTGYEAILLDKPLIVIARDYELAYCEMGAAIQVDSIDGIVNALKEIQEQETLQKLKEARKRFIDYFLNGNDGKASSNIAEHIQSLI